jgi:hypothetical protein
MAVLVWARCFYAAPHTVMSHTLAALWEQLGSHTHMFESAVGVFEAFKLFSWGTFRHLLWTAHRGVQTTRQGHVAARARGKRWQHVHLLRIHGQSGGV